MIMFTMENNQDKKRTNAFFIFHFSQVDLLRDKGELEAQLDNMAEAELPLFEVTDMMRLELDGNYYPFCHFNYFLIL